MKQPALYILANQRNGTLYTGVTHNLPRRIWEHKNNLVPGFTKKYNVYYLHYLVYYEIHGDMYAAVSREKQIKRWSREWKLELIEKFNPEWKDLYESLF